MLLGLVLSRGSIVLRVDGIMHLAELVLEVVRGNKVLREVREMLRWIGPVDRSPMVRVRSWIPVSLGKQMP